MTARYIDINTDMGEGFGRYHLCDDTRIMPYISSANIACGYHAGDAIVIETTIKNAIDHGLRIGAHPSYPDRQGFGRRYMQVAAEELASMIRYQLAAIDGLCRANGAQVSYVKPHGALYNRMAKDESEAEIVIKAIQSILPEASVMVLAHSVAGQVAESLSVPVIREAFIDRRYAQQCQLMSRQKSGSLITDPQIAYEQLRLMAIEQKIETEDGCMTELRADSYCIHGDNPNALEILTHLHEQMAKDGIHIKS